MVIFKIERDYFSLAWIDPERDPPVPRDGQAPGTLSIPGKLMGPPRRNVLELASIVHFLQECQDVPDFLHSGGRQARNIVPLNEPSQPPVNNVPDQHDQCYRQTASPVKLRFTSLGD